jgi:hypothetical protein
VSREAELELVILEAAFGGNVHQFLRQFAKAQIVKLNLCEKVIAKPREEIKGHRRHLQEVFDRLVAAGA